MPDMLSHRRLGGTRELYPCIRDRLRNLEGKKWSQLTKDEGRGGNSAEYTDPSFVEARLIFVDVKLIVGGRGSGTWKDPKLNRSLVLCDFSVRGTPWSKLRTPI